MVSLDLITVQCLAVGVVTQWATAPVPVGATANRPRRLLLWTIVVLVCISFSWQKPIGNHFDLLGLTTNASPYDITSRYREMVNSLTNQLQVQAQLKEAKEKLQQAAEVLVSPKRRSIYERFGDYAVDGKLEEEAAQILVTSCGAVFHLLLFAWGFVMSTPRRLRGSRPVLGLLCMSSLVVEFFIRFEPKFTPVSIWPLSKMLAFEIVQFIQRLMPSVFALVLLICGLMYTDHDAAVLHLLHTVVLANRVIALELAKQAGDHKQQPSGVDGPTTPTTPGPTQTKQWIFHSIVPLAFAIACYLGQRYFGSSGF